MTEDKTLPYWRNMRSAMEWLPAQLQVPFTNAP